VRATTNVTKTNLNNCTKTAPHTDKDRDKIKGITTIPTKMDDDH
jgi:hypothetical protein